MTFPKLIAQVPNFVEGSIVDLPGGFKDNTVTAAVNIQNLFSNIIGFLTIVAGLAFILYFILGAIGWITGGGDQQKVENAKNQMTSAAIGLIIIVASYMIIGIVGAVLGIDILNFHQLGFLNDDKNALHPLPLSE